MSGRRNVFKALARLTARSPALVRVGSPGTGGSDEPPDLLAGALGWAKQECPFAVEILCMRWWPGYATQTQSQVRGKDWQIHLKPRERVIRDTVREPDPDNPGRTRKVRTKHRDHSFPTPVKHALTTGRGQHARNSGAVESVLTTWTLNQWGIWKPDPTDPAACLFTGWRNVPPAVYDRILKAHGYREYAMAERLVLCVLDEYVNPAHCHECRGEGQVVKSVKAEGKPVESKKVDCETCLGQGIVPRGVKRRAKAFRIRAEDFKHYIEPAYVWLLGNVRQFEHRASRAIYRAMLDEETTPA